MEAPASQPQDDQAMHSDVTPHDASSSQSEAGASAAAHLQKTVVQRNVPHLIERLQEDEESPLYAVAEFDTIGLAPELLQGIREMGFKRPSRIQAVVLPFILESQQAVIAQSQSGTGKTATFGLALLSKIDRQNREPQGLVLAPTRELARQISDEMWRMSKFMEDTRITCCIPGYDFSSGIRSQIVVGTPGRVKDAMERRCLDITKLRMFVLDEADVMLEQTGNNNSFAPNAGTSILIKRMAPKDCQLLLFSATYDDRVREFCMMFAPNAKRFTLREQTRLNLQYIKQCQVNLGGFEDKFAWLNDIWTFLDVNQAIIFVNTRELARQLAENLRRVGHTVAVLRADMSADERDSVLDEFRHQKQRILIATNVIARGVDVVEVSVVVNYEMPFIPGPNGGQVPDPETYLHRIGRCGRFGRPGVAINFLSDERDHACLAACIAKYGGDARQIQRTEQLQELVGADPSEAL